MKKLMLLCMAAGALTFSACREDSGTSTETNKDDSATPDAASGSTQQDSTSTTAYNYDAEYRERSTRLARQVTADLRLDQTTQERMQTVYYNRARQISELERSYSSANASGGSIGDDSMMGGDMNVEGYPEDRPKAYYTELENINSNVDMELKGFLTPEQFKAYQTNRQKYYASDIKYETTDGDKMKLDGDEAKVKAGDTKIKRDGDEMKVKIGDAKMKRDGNETKIKAGDTKIKTEGNETKVKTDDGKIKMEE